MPRTLILGATGGIGSVLALHLAGMGHQLVLVGRNAEKLDELKAETNGNSYVADATQLAEAESVFEQVTKAEGAIDCAINCVGSLLLKPAHRTSEAEWFQTLNTNLTSAFALVRSATKVMQKNGGSIVLCASAAAKLGLPNHEAIAAAKAGVIGLTLSAVATYAKRNIRVNCVAPGLIETPLSAPILKNDASSPGPVRSAPGCGRRHYLVIANRLGHWTGHRH